MITLEIIQKPFFFGGGGVGGVGGVGGWWGRRGINCQIFKLAVNSRTQSRNTHWLEKSVTTVHDKPWKLFCKTSLNARG